MINWSEFNIVGNEKAYLLEALESRWVSGGSYVNKLEEHLQNMYDGYRVLSVCNGTLALQLAFQTIGIKPGDEVIVPSFCFQAAGNVLHQIGATPVYCDVDPLSWNQTIQTINEARTEKTVAIVVVHNYGMPADVKNIKKYSQENGLWLVEDCAEAWFTEHDGKYVGQYGDVSTWSMHATKTVSCGEGGIVLINDKTLVKKAELYRSHGLDRNKVRYLHELPGNNYRLSNLLASIAFAQVEKYEEVIKKRKAVNQKYFELLKKHDLISFQAFKTKDIENLWAIGVLINFNFLEISRDQLMEILSKKGIETRPGFYSASEMDYNKNTKVQSNASDRLSKSIIALPCSWTLTEEDINIICKTLIDILEEKRKPNTNFKIINPHNSEEFGINFENFYPNLKKGRESFRYFENRNLEAVKNHYYNTFIKLGNEVIAYGHIDYDEKDKKLWLGIAIIDRYVGCGWGNLIMHDLIKHVGNNQIYLRVDKANKGAKSLYSSFGFVELNDESVESYLMGYFPKI
jgi:perosamine synthetase